MLQNIGIDAILYLGVVITLFVAMILLIIHYFNPKNKEYVEEAKYRILEDDNPTDETKGE